MRRALSGVRWQPLAAAALAAGGASIAWLAPVSELEAVRSWLIGSAIGPFRHETAHRLTASLGSLLGALVLWRLFSLRPAAKVTVPHAWIGAAIFALLILLNGRWAGVALGIWRWWWPWLGVLYLPALAALVIYMLVAFGIVARASLTMKGLPTATGAGVACGAFSALWHCCCPLWDTPHGRGALHALLAASVTSAGALAFVGFAGAAPARWPWPWSGAIGALLFGAAYSWHTPAFFGQCLLGGALAVWMVQTSGNALAGGVFLAAAFESHLTLPYMGWWGALVPLALISASCVALGRVPADGARPEPGARTG